LVFNSHNSVNLCICCLSSTSCAERTSFLEIVDEFILLAALLDDSVVLAAFDWVGLRVAVFLSLSDATTPCSGSGYSTFYKR
jgi:hypothetical protein